MRRLPGHRRFAFMVERLTCFLRVVGCSTTALLCSIAPACAQHLRTADEGRPRETADRIVVVPCDAWMVSL